MPRLTVERHTFGGKGDIWELSALPAHSCCEPHCSKIVYEKIDCSQMENGEVDFFKLVKQCFIKVAAYQSCFAYCRIFLRITRGIPLRHIPTCLHFFGIVFYLEFYEHVKES